MTDSAAVSVRGLAKAYHIGAPAGTGSLYDRLAATMGLRGRSHADDPTIWALKDVDFDVAPGQVLGILGRNGSGKSTLMKILSRVTPPTQGYAVVMGRVGALLQVGTGFHPELSGRDNIALSGAILGMSKNEVRAVQDQIVDFAEIGQFLDTAVKHYSTGMYLRLAFSVSAHLAADVLLIDEVLSVGDTAFQEKCRVRIRSLVAEGRTVLFVSHGLETVRSLCDRAIVLDHGSIVFAGPTEEGVAAYRSLMASVAATRSG